MTPAFLDTVRVIALLDESDQWNAAAVDAYAAVRARRQPVLATSCILLECGNAAARRPYRQAVDDLRRRLDSQGSIVVPTEGDLETAWIAYRRGEAGEAGIVDHVSFVVMRRLGLQQAFTNDRHFVAAGFEILF